MLQTVPFANRAIRASITLPGSKSLTNRALLLASLAKGISTLSNILISDDTRIFINALKNLGLNLSLDGTNCQVEGASGKFPAKEANIFCGDAGTAARFLLAVCAATPGKFYVDASDRLKARPLRSLIIALNQLGANIDGTSLPLIITGKHLSGGKLTIPTHESSQFASALLMASPLFLNKFSLTPEETQLPYLRMTKKLMEKFNVQVETNGACFSITPQTYAACDYNIEPDLSTASYFFAAAALTQGSITISNINVKHTLQGDVKFLAILKKMGCEVITHSESVTVSNQQPLQGIEVDMRDCSDTFMTLAAIAPFAKSPTIIKNIGHTRLQESNRITAMRQCLEKANVKVEETENSLCVYPSKVQAAQLPSFNDHRIAMSNAILGLTIQGMSIENPGCVSKTCPDFFEKLKYICTIN